MHNVYVLAFAVLISTGVQSANSPAWMDVPKDIQILRLPWISKSMVHAMCAEHHPELTAKYSYTIPVHQAEVRKAEAMVRKDVSERGAAGQRYLAAYVKETQQLIDQTLKDAATAPPPSEQECLPVVSAAAKAENLYRMWNFFAHQTQEKEASAARAQKGAN